MRILGDKAPSDAELVLVDPERDANDAAAVAENDPVQIEPQSSNPSEGVGGSSPAASDDSTVETVAAPGQAEVSNQNYVPDSSSVTTVAKSKKVPKPKIGSRSSWGAKSYSGSPDYASGIKQAVIHHTDGSNSYSAEDVPAVLRGIQSFHQKGRGWNDIGYNVLADKYGRLWQGRGGDINKAVIGAHTAGHNTGTVGISVLAASTPRRSAEEDPRCGGSGDRLEILSQQCQGRVSRPSSVTVTSDTTACPGDAFYSKFGEIRSTVSDVMKSGDLPSDKKKDDSKKDDKKNKTTAKSARNTKKDDSKKDDSKKDDGKTATPKPKTEIEKYAADHAKELGKATGKEHDLKGVDGARARAYEKGNVYWSKKTGAYHLTGSNQELVQG